MEALVTNEILMDFQVIQYIDLIISLLGGFRAALGSCLGLRLVNKGVILSHSFL